VKNKKVLCLTGLYFLSAACLAESSIGISNGNSNKVTSAAKVYIRVIVPSITVIQSYKKDGDMCNVTVWSNEKKININGQFFYTTHVGENSFSFDCETKVFSLVNP
jgi:hypothetical protein